MLLENETPEEQEKRFSERRDRINKAKEGPIDIGVLDVIDFNVYFNWGQKGVGFGQCSVNVENGSDTVVIHGELEGMKIEWTRRALHTLVDSIMDQFPKDADSLSPQITIQRAMVKHGISFPEGGMEHFRAVLGQMVNRYVMHSTPAPQENMTAPAGEEPRSRFGSTELQSLIVARAVEKDLAAQVAPAPGVPSDDRLYEAASHYAATVGPQESKGAFFFAGADFMRKALAAAPQPPAPTTDALDANRLFMCASLMQEAALLLEDLGLAVIQK